MLLVVTGCTSNVQQEDLVEQTQAPADSRQTISDADRYQYRQAITALNANELDSAESLLKGFIAKKPELAGPLANLGLVFYKQGKMQLAEQTLQQALEKNSTQAHALNLLGQIEYQKGNAAMAEEYYKKAIESRPDYANAYYNLALLYDIFYQDIPKAVSNYQRYMALTDNKDQQTANWLEQLQNSLKSN